MKLRNSILALAVVAMTAGACSSPQTSALRFREDGTFKIVQFTDTHIIYGNPASDRADSVIKETLDAEKPDLVVFTGDQIFGKPAAPALQQQFSIVAEYGIPFAYTFGNHDQEHDLTGRELLSYAMGFKGFLLSGPADSTIGKAYGDIPVLSSKSDSTAAVIYVFDSGDYSTLKASGVGGYGWITRGQIDLYSRKSRAYAKNNGGPVPSVAFYHIPIPEYRGAAAEDALKCGTFNENVCCPEINTGLFAEMLERGDMIANFVGHDHDNNYVFLNKGIALCYGQYSGGNTVYNNIGAGARIIELHEGRKELRTWIRMLGGEVKDEVTIPTSFQQ